jgi:hypothetical protein
MKKLIYLLIAIVAFSTFAFAQPKTVTDFYLAMPSNLYNFTQIKDKAALTKYRKKNIKIEDIKNGYLRIESNDLEGHGEVALFKKNDGSYIVGQTDVGCGPVCGGGVDFWTYKAGKWVKVTDQVFNLSEEEWNELFGSKNVEENDRTAFFELPRQGKTMTLKCDDCDPNGDGVLAKFEWNGTKFVKK